MPKIKKTTIRTQQGIEVYENNIFIAVDAYIESLPNEKDIYNRLCFPGCLRYIYKTCFKPTNKDLIYNRRSSIVDYKDIELIYNIYNIYIDLCSRYKQECSKNGFYTMTGISQTTILDWEKGKNIPTVEGKPASLWSGFAKKLDKNAEYSLNQSMLQGNLMSYALLKCWYGYTETPQRIEVVNAGADKTEGELIEEYGRQSIEQKEKSIIDFPEIEEQ